MIKKVGLKNVRGITREIELGKKTIITGPNGSGKSSVLVGMQFPVFGLIPGYKKKQTIANASDAEMSASVTIGDHCIERILRQGQTLQDRVKINGGTETDAKAATGMIELVVGKDPLLMNMPAFYDVSDTGKRRRIVALVADEDVQNKLEEKEKSARAAKNKIVAERQAADKAVEHLLKSLTELEKPAGNLPRLKEELKQVKADLKECEDRVNKGKANDAARDKCFAMVSDIPSLNDIIHDLKKQFVEAEKKSQSCHEALNGIGDPPERTVSDMGLSEKAKGIVADVILQLSEAGFVLEGHITLRDEVVCKLEQLLPDEEDVLADAKAFEEFEKLRDLRVNESKDADDERDRIAKDLSDAEDNLSRAVKADEYLNDIGPGLDPNDEKTANGLIKRRDEIEKKVNDLEKIDTLNCEVKKAQIEADAANEAEKKAKEDLSIVLEEQANIVRDASKTLSERSRHVLPFGELMLTDDGINIDIVWKMNDKKTVSRTSLSGGEQAIFDCSLGHALAPTALVAIEGAEMDDDRIQDVMNNLLEHEFQAVIMTCHAPDSVPDGWTHIKM
jgi:DNA repair exonuclease SbcCD ATPase subunit